MPAKLHWQRVRHPRHFRPELPEVRRLHLQDNVVLPRFIGKECGIHDTSFQIFMYVTFTLAKQSGGTTLFLWIVEHMTKELSDPFHRRDHRSKDKFQRSAAKRHSSLREINVEFFIVGVGAPAPVHQHDVINGTLCRKMSVSIRICMMYSTCEKLLFYP